jgi:nitrile hydratase
MNGVHDLGGMHGFGPVRPETNEPVFHAPWEGRVIAMRRLMGAWLGSNIDAGRHAIERLPPADYLRFSYYEKWFQSLINQMVAAKLVTPDEVASGHKAPDATTATPPITLANVQATSIAPTGSYQRDTGANARFAPGETVRARNIHPEGHTRLPRYVRGHVGTIERDHGAHVLPDTHAHGAGEAPETLYTVRFTARELWGDARHEGDAVYLDLWESYLDPA